MTRYRTEAAKSKEREWKARNKDRINEQQRKCRRDNPERYREYRKRKTPDQKAIEYRNALSRLRKKNGFTPEAFQKRFADQLGVCAICKTKPTTDGDHSHETGHSRGILCRQCNHLLGLAKDSPTILESAIEYLRLWVNHVDLV